MERLPSATPDHLVDELFEIGLLLVPLSRRHDPVGVLVRDVCQRLDWLIADIRTANSSEAASAGPVIT